MHTYNLQKNKQATQREESTKRMLRYNCSILIPLCNLYLHTSFKLFYSSSLSSNWVHYCHPLRLFPGLHYITILTKENRKKKYTQSLKLDKNHFFFSNKNTHHQFIKLTKKIKTKFKFFQNFQIIKITC